MQLTSQDEYQAFYEDIFKDTEVATLVKEGIKDENRVFFFAANAGLKHQTLTGRPDSEQYAINREIAAQHVLGAAATGGSGGDFIATHCELGTGITAVITTEIERAGLEAFVGFAAYLSPSTYAALPEAIKTGWGGCTVKFTPPQVDVGGGALAQPPELEFTVCTIKNIESTPLWRGGDGVGRGHNAWRLVRDEDGAAVVAQSFLYQCESTFTTEALKKALTKGFAMANNGLPGVATLNEEDIGISITAKLGSTVRMVALTIKAGVERARWMAEVTIPEGVGPDGKMRVSRSIPIYADPMPRYGGAKMHWHAIERAIEEVVCPNPRLTRTKPAPPQLQRGRRQDLPMRPRLRSRALPTPERRPQPPVPPIAGGRRGRALAGADAAAAAADVDAGAGAEAAAAAGVDAAGAGAAAAAADATAAAAAAAAAGDAAAAAVGAAPVGAATDDAADAVDDDAAAAGGVDAAAAAAAAAGPPAVGEPAAAGDPRTWGPARVRRCGLHGVRPPARSGSVVAGPRLRRERADARGGRAGQERPDPTPRKWCGTRCGRGHACTRREGRRQRTQRRGR